MSEIARPVSDSPLAPVVAPDPRSSRWRRPPIWLWALSLGLQVACAAALTNFTYFFLDDYVFLNQARQEPFDLTYLRASLYEHFSALSRLLDKLLVVVAPGSWVFAHGVELALYAGALVAFAWVMRTVLGNGWGAFILTVVFGQSLFLVRLLYWWTATANILPSTLFMLLAIASYLRWRETGGLWLLFASFAAYALALLDYETALLFPAYLAAISLLVLERRPGPRAWALTLWRERWAWIGYVVLDVAALVNYYSFYYYPRGARPSNSALAHYLAIALFQTFIPSLLGINYPQAAIVTILAASVLGVAVIATLYLRPRAWRCVVAFILVFLVTMLPVGLNRIVSRGVAVGGILYYQQSAQFMFLVLTAFAISSRWGGQRTTHALARSGRVWRWLAARRPSRRTVAVGAVAVAAAYGALYVTSLQAMDGQQWQADKDSVYVSRYLASDRRLRATIGHEPVLVDLRLPTRLLPKALWPYTSYGEFFALFNPRLRVDEITNPIYVVDRQGQLLRVGVSLLTSGVIEHASLSSGGVKLNDGRSAACVPAGRPRSWLRVPLARAERVGHAPYDLAYVLRVRFRMPSDSSVAVRLLPSRHARGAGTAPQVWNRGSGGDLIALDYNGSIRDVEFALPARGCITGLAVGRLYFVSGA